VHAQGHAFIDDRAVALRSAQGVSQDIWIIPFDGGAPRKIAEGSEPAISPKGDRIAFLRKGELWSIGVEDGAKPARADDAETDVELARQVGRRMSNDPREQERIMKNFIEWSKSRR